MNEKLNIVNKKLSDFSIYNNGTWQSEKEITTNYCPDLGMGCPYQGPTDCDVGNLKSVQCPCPLFLILKFGQGPWSETVNNPK